MAFSLRTVSIPGALSNAPLITTVYWSHSLAHWKESLWLPIVSMLWFSLMRAATRVYAEDLNKSYISWVSNDQSPSSFLNQRQKNESREVTSLVFGQQSCVMNKHGILRCILPNENGLIFFLNPAKTSRQRRKTSPFTLKTAPKYCERNASDERDCQP